MLLIIDKALERMPRHTILSHAMRHEVYDDRAAAGATTERTLRSFDAPVDGVGGWAVNMVGWLNRGVGSEGGRCDFVGFCGRARGRLTSWLR